MARSSWRAVLALSVGEMDPADAPEQQATTTTATSEAATAFRRLRHCALASRHMPPILVADIGSIDAAHRVTSWLGPLSRGDGRPTRILFALVQATGPAMRRQPKARTARRAFALLVAVVRAIITVMVVPVVAAEEGTRVDDAGLASPHHARIMPWRSIGQRVGATEPPVFAIGWG